MAQTGLWSARRVFGVSPLLISLSVWLLAEVIAGGRGGGFVSALR
ncbi:hypothetical protein ACWEPC_23660 [Nonomuraea sp. NPDC004297]